MTTTTGYESLDPCVHCGFCLPACPTYLATGDEADSPRGRIVLMRALERGELAADDDALLAHLDACLGCRGCEPVCPSGVGYGRGLETAREQLFRTRGLPARARWVLSVFRKPLAWRTLFGLARLLRQTGLPARLASGSRLGFAMGMLAATDGSGRTGAVGSRREQSGGGISPARSRPLPSAPVRVTMLITISRQYGAGGSEVARRVADALGWRLVDNDLVEQVGARAGLSPEEVAGIEERTPSFIERLAQVLATATPELFPPATGTVPELSEATLVRITEAVVAEAAAEGRAVLVGRAAPAVLARERDALHVKLVAPRPFRIRVTAGRLGLDPRTRSG